MFSIDSLFTSGKEKDDKMNKEKERLKEEATKELVSQRLKKIETGMQEKTNQNAAFPEDYNSFQVEGSKEKVAEISLFHDPVETQDPVEEVGNKTKANSSAFFSKPAISSSFMSQAPQVNEVNNNTNNEANNEVSNEENKKSKNEVSDKVNKEIALHEDQSHTPEKEKNLLSIILAFKEEKSKATENLKKALQEKEKFKELESQATKEVEAIRKEKESLSRNFDALKKTQTEHEEKIKNLEAEKNRLEELSLKYEETNRLVKKIVNLVGIKTEDFNDSEDTVFLEKSLEQIENQIKNI